MSKMRRIKLAVLVFGLLIIAGIVLLPWILKTKVESEIAKIEAAGDPIRTADLAETIPDEENAAVVYARAFEIISESPAKDEIDSALGLLSQEKREENPALWDEARETVDKYRHVLLIAEEAAERPRCRFPFNWDEGPLVMFPEYAQVPRLARLSAMSSLIAARDADMEEAVRWLELTHKIGESLKDEPGLTSYYVRSSCISTGSVVLSEALGHGALDEGQARRLYDFLASIDLIAGHLLAVKCERAMGIDMFRIVHRNGPYAFSERTELSDDDSNRSKSESNTSNRISWFGKLFLYTNELYYLKLSGKDVVNAGIPYRKAVSTEIDEDCNLSCYTVMARVLHPGFGRTRLSRDECITRIAGDRILLALLTHKQRVGGYPGTLDELRESLGWEIPEDPFSGEDFIYTREAQGFLLYSIGPNLRDDGGKESTPLERRENPDADHDIVWRMER